MTELAIFHYKSVIPKAIPHVVVLTSFLSGSAMAFASSLPTTVGNRFQAPRFYTASTPPNVPVGNPARIAPHVDTLFDLKSRSGLTWDELAMLFGVSRRSLHHWMNGKPLTAEHELTLGRLRAFLVLISKPDHLQCRATLLAPTMLGKTVYDLLRVGQFDVATKELTRLPATQKLVVNVQPDSGRPHPIQLLDQADITLTARPKDAVGKRLHINKLKSRG